MLTTPSSPTRATAEMQHCLSPERYLQRTKTRHGIEAGGAEANNKRRPTDRLDAADSTTTVLMQAEEARTAPVPPPASGITSAATSTAAAVGAATARIFHGAVHTIPNVVTSLTQISRSLLPGGGGSGGDGAAGSTSDSASDANAAAVADAAVRKGKDVRMGVVAELLLKEGMHLVALELHQELLERGNGSHKVACLNEFFGDSEKLTAVLEDEAIASRASSTLAGVVDECVPSTVWAGLCCVARLVLAPLLCGVAEI